MQKRLLNKGQRKGIGAFFGGQSDLGSVSIALALGIYLCTFIMYQTTLAIYFPDWFTRVAQVVCLGFLLIAEVQRGRYGRRELFAFILLILAAAVALNAAGGSFFVMAAILIVARNYDYRMLLKVALLCVIICCIFTVFAALLGLSLNYIWQQGDRVRYGLGFKYTSYLSQHVFYGTLIYVFLKKGKAGLLPSVAIVILAAIAYFVSDSRTPFGLTVLILLLAPLLCKKEIRNPDLVKWIVSIVFCLIVAFSIVLFFVYDPSIEWEWNLNAWLGNRLSISHRTYELYGLSLFGQDVHTSGQGLGEDLKMSTFADGVTFIDNSYCNVLFHYGPVVLAVFIFLFCTMIWRATENGDVVFLLILIFIMVHSYIDSLWISLPYDAFWVLVGSYAIRQRAAHARQKVVFK